MEDLCSELDDLVIQYCDTLQQLTEVKQRMHNAMRQGFYDLSKARNSMGIGQAGAVQFNYKQMRAQAHIQLREAQDDSIYDFQLKHHKDCKVETKKTQSTQLGAGDSTSNIEELSTLTNDDDNDENNDETQLSLDPLRWFGILVPQALRHCQSDFVHALRESSQLASLQSKLVGVKHQYRRLLKKKAELLEDSDERDS